MVSVTRLRQWYGRASGLNVSPTYDTESFASSPVPTLTRQLLVVQSLLGCPTTSLGALLSNRWWLKSVNLTQVLLFSVFLAWVSWVLAECLDPLSSYNPHVGHCECNAGLEDSAYGCTRVSRPSTIIDEITVRLSDYMAQNETWFFPHKQARFLDFFQSKSQKYDGKFLHRRAGKLARQMNPSFYIGSYFTSDR